MKPYYYVLYGAAIPRAKFPGDPYDDRWEPFREGREGVEMSILDGGSNESIYCGKILATTDPYEDFENKPIELDAAMQVRVVLWLGREFGWQEMPQLMLVCIWL